MRTAGAAATLGTVAQIAQRERGGSMNTRTIAVAALVIAVIVLLILLL